MGERKTRQRIFIRCAMNRGEWKVVIGCEQTRVFDAGSEKLTKMEVPTPY